jgi:hypothetical protein
MTHTTAQIKRLTSLRLLKAALMRDLLFFARALRRIAARTAQPARRASTRRVRVKKSRQKKALFPDKANLKLYY